MASDLLTTIRGELEARLAELRPLLSEYDQLVAAAEALDARAIGTVAPSEVAVQAPSRSEAKTASSAARVARAPGAEDVARTPSRVELERASSQAPELERASSQVETERASSGADVETTPSEDTEPSPSAVVVDTPPEAPRPRRGRGARGSAAGTIERAASGSTADPGASKPPRAARGAAEQAILAALEHGSHTAGELVTVTAMSSQSIRTSLSRLVMLGKVSKTKRESKTAYALSGGAAGA
jgi:hypothetical protein